MVVQPGRPFGGVADAGAGRRPSSSTALRPQNKGRDRCPRRHAAPLPPSGGRPLPPRSGPAPPSVRRWTDAGPAGDRPPRTGPSLSVEIVVHQRTLHARPRLATSPSVTPCRPFLENQVFGGVEDLLEGFGALFRLAAAHPFRRRPIRHQARPFTRREGLPGGPIQRSDASPLAKLPAHVVGTQSGLVNLPRGRQRHGLDLQHLIGQPPVGDLAAAARR